VPGNAFRHFEQSKPVRTSISCCKQAAKARKRATTTRSSRPTACGKTPAAATKKLKSPEPLVKDITLNHAPCLHSVTGSRPPRKRSCGSDSVAPCGPLCGGNWCHKCCRCFRRVPTADEQLRIARKWHSKCWMPTRSTKLGSVRMRHFERYRGAGEAGNRQGMLNIGTCTRGSSAWEKPNRGHSCEYQRAADAGDSYRVSSKLPSLCSTGLGHSGQIRNRLTTGIKLAAEKKNDNSDVSVVTRKRLYDRASRLGRS